MSSASFTSFPSSFSSSFCTGAKENSFFTSPFGLPRCEQRITFALFSIKYFFMSFIINIVACI